MSNIFRTGRPTNFKLGTQTQHEDPHQRQGPWPSRSKVKVSRSRDASDRCLPISRERNVLGRPKLVRLSSPRAIMRPRFKVKDGVWRPVSQTSAVTRPATAETETVSYLLNRKTYKPAEHTLSTVTPNYKAVKLGSCTRAYWNQKQQDSKALIIIFYLCTYTSKLNMSQACNEWLFFRVLYGADVYNAVNATVKYNCCNQLINEAWKWTEITNHSLQTQTNQ